MLDLNWRDDTHDAPENQRVLVWTGERAEIGLRRGYNWISDGKQWLFPMQWAPLPEAPKLAEPVRGQASFADQIRATRLVIGVGGSE